MCVVVVFILGKGRGLAKKGGGGGGYTWGVPGSELLEEYNEELDDDELADLQYNEAKAKLLAKSNATTADAPSTLETKMTKLELIGDMEKDVKPLIAEYFANGDANDVAQSLRKFDFKQQGGGELIAYIVTMAVEKSNVHKELISRLLHDLKGIILRSNDYIDGFNSLLTSLVDLSLDNPDCSTDIGSSEEIRSRKTSDLTCSSLSQANLSLVPLPINVLIIPMENILPNTKVTWNVRKCKRHSIKLKRWFPWAISTFWIIFGMLNQVNCSTHSHSHPLLSFSSSGGGFRPVRELADRMNVIIQEYYDSGDVDETNRCLKELNVPHFFHEFVYELIDFCLEKNTERFVDWSRYFRFNRFVSSRAQQLTIDLLEKLTKSAVITYDQLKTGMLRIFDDIEDIHLDVPNVYEQLQVLLKRLEEKKILNHDITSNAPVKGRKRVTSEGDNQKQEKSTNWSQCELVVLLDRALEIFDSFSKFCTSIDAKIVIL